MSRIIPANILRSFERRAVEKHGAPHLRQSKAVNGREQEILRRPRDKLDIHAVQRKDLSRLKAYAIDGEGAIFYDDAVSYDSKSRCVLVHIADPSAYFPGRRRDPIVQDALKKAKTIYATRSQLSMLPQTLNKRRFSLDEKRNPMPALTFSFSVRRDGSIRTSSVAVEHTYINVTNLSYEEAREDITSNKELRRLRRVAEKLKDYREGVIQSRRGRPSKPQHTKNPSKMMVEELMIATKTAAGKYTKKYGIPVLYLRAKSDCLDRNNRNTKQKSSNERCKKLSVHAGRHDGVGADAFVGVTSPLRNAVDLISHMQIKAYLDKKKSPFSRQYLTKYADRFESMEDRIRQVENTIDDQCQKLEYKNCRRRW